MVTPHVRAADRVVEREGEIEQRPPAHRLADRVRRKKRRREVADRRVVRDRWAVVVDEGAAEAVGVGGERCDREYHARPGEFDIVRCWKCGHVYLNPLPAPEEVAALYPPTYYTVNPNSPLFHESKLIRWKMGKDARDFRARWGERRLTMMNLTPEQRKKWEQRFEDGRKEGMKMLVDFRQQGNDSLKAGAPGFTTFQECAACNAATFRPFKTEK